MKNRDMYKHLEKHINSFVDSYPNDIISKTKRETKKSVRDFIEKMAIWYELRYPDCEVTKIIELYYENKDITRDFLNFNPDLISSNKESLKWPNIYNFNMFYASLTDEEKKYIDKPIYPRRIKLYDHIYDSIFVSKEGMVDKGDFNMLASNYGVDRGSLKTLYIREVVNSFKIKLPKNSPVFKEIYLYERKNILRTNILKCIMYRIMLRGDKKTSLRRAFLFSQEFENLHMSFIADYAIYYEDYDLLITMSDYLSSISSEDINLNNKVNKNIKLRNLF